MVTTLCKSIFAITLPQVYPFIVSRIRDFSFCVPKPLLLFVRPLDSILFKNQQNQLKSLKKMPAHPEGVHSLVRMGFCFHFKFLLEINLRNQKFMKSDWKQGLYVYNTYFANHIEWTEHKTKILKSTNKYQIKLNLFFLKLFFSMITSIIHFFIEQNFCKYFLLSHK